MISNLYTWIFPAALFAAAGLSNLSPSVKRKRNPARAGSNKVVWFSLNISIAFCFLMGSVFFVKWSEIDWSLSYLYYSLAVLGIFYLGFLFKYIIGLPLVFIFTLIVLFFNIYFQDWREVPSGGVIGKYRILSHDTSGVKAEVSGFSSSPVFAKGEGSVLTLNFKVLELDKMLFFIKSGSYYRMADIFFESGLSDLIIDFMAENSFLLSGNTYMIDIADKALLYQYSIVLDIDQKKIFIEN